jgi:hypothetical protein
MEATSTGFRLSTGREFTVSNIIGLAKNRHGWVIAGGYDAIIAGATGDADESEGNWTPEERRELADYMIRLWQEFKQHEERS